MPITRKFAILLGGAALTLAAPVFADVKAGVDAWSRGDYPAAVKEWRDPAAKGDADAQFNLAQAYRLGRGVETNAKQAEVLYAKAAAQGHIKAADNYGLLLFQDGRRQEALPYIEAASGRGDPRAQYLLGIAHFNGDLVAKDWVRAYALLTLANSAGLPQAPPAIQQMDDFISLADRQQAQVLAQQLKNQADSSRTQQLAAADLAMGGGTTAVAPPRQAAAPTTAPLPSRATRIPQLIPSTAIAPSVAAAQAAISEATRVTGTQSPALAGADYSQRPTSTDAPAPVTAPAPAPTRIARADPVAPVRAPDPAPAPARVTSSAPTTTSGPWRVQLGAFSVRGNADRLWGKLASTAALSGKDKLLVPAGRLTKLQAGGFASRSAAQSACTTLKSSGQPCLVTRQ